MRIRLIGGIAALAVALGALALPSAGPAQAGSAKCTGWTSTLIPPTSIRVYRTATGRTETVRFRTYVQKVMASEWGTTAPEAALRVGAVAAKQFAWYYAIFWRGGRDADGSCYDVRDSSIDQVYDPSRRTVTAHAAAVAATWTISLRKGERFFLTGYRPGTGSCTAHVDGWKLYQRDAVDCVRSYGDLAERLARRFYSDVSWITPGAGDYTGDGRGDLAVLSVAPDTGETTGEVYTADAAYRAAVGARPPRAAAIATTPLDRLLGRAAGDVDGDGRTDLVQLVRTDDGVALEVMRGSPTGLAPATTWWRKVTDPVVPADPSVPVDPSVPAGTTYRLAVGDFDGDGRADAGVVRIHPGLAPAAPGDQPPAPADPPVTALDLAISSGDGFGRAERAWKEAADLTASAFLAGDVNGDGRADFVVLTPLETGGTALQVAASDARGSLAPMERWGTEPVALDAIRPLVADADRDGREDLIVVRRVGEDAIRVVVYRGPTAGTSFSRLNFTDVLPVSFAGTRFSSSDATGDGRADLFALVNRGIDADGNPLGTDVVHFDSTGTTFTQRPWFSSPTMAWETTFPY